MRSGHDPKFIGRSQADKTTEVFQVVLVSTSCSRVVQVGKPLDRGWNLGQRLKFDRREPTLIIRMVFRQFLHIVLIIGYPAIALKAFGHKIIAISVRRC